MSRFDLCLPFTLAQECPHPSDWSNPANFSNDRHDPGGKTMCGIIQREYDYFRKANALPVRDVREISEAEGHTIYLHNYWNPHCDSLPAGLDLVFFDSAVNMGSHEAIVLLQRALMLQADGVWGPATEQGVKLIADARVTITGYSTVRTFAYKSMRGFPYFGTDWLRRTAEIKAHALKMVQP